MDGWWRDKYRLNSISFSREYVRIVMAVWMIRNRNVSWKCMGNKVGEHDNGV